jgi:hypothetical protein
MNTLRGYLPRSRKHTTHQQTNRHHTPTHRTTPDVHTPLPLTLSLR